MNWLDFIIVVLIALAALAGVRRGFVRGAVDLVVVLTSLFAAAIGYRYVADLIESLFGYSGVLVNVIGFVVVALLVQGALSFLLGSTILPLARRARNLSPVRWVDNMFGIIPGVIKGIGMAAVVVLFATLLPLGMQFDATVGASSLSQRLLNGATDVTYWAQDAAGINLADFTVMVTQENQESYQLPFAVEEGLEINEADEAEMIALVNEERNKNGLPSLAFDPELRDVGRGHSEEMLRMGYFAHISPVTGSAGDRLQAAEVPFQVAGENLAYAPTVAIAHRGLMRSDGHRANILSPDFTRIGVGVVTTPLGAKMFTQVFAAP